MLRSTMELGILVMQTTSITLIYLLCCVVAFVKPANFSLQGFTPQVLNFLTPGLLSFTATFQKNRHSNDSIQLIIARL